MSGEEEERSGEVKATWSESDAHRVREEGVSESVSREEESASGSGEVSGEVRESAHDDGRYRVGAGSREQSGRARHS